MKLKINDICGKRTVTRADGRKLSQIILDNWRKTDKIEIDFGHLLIASVSFMDEAFGALGLKFTQNQIVTKISVRNITPQDRQLLNDIMRSRFRQRQLQKV
jgi:hypothetical protein